VLTKDTLAKLDTNNDGKLSYDEYIKLIEHLFTDLYNGTHPGQALLTYSENLFRTMDSDGNGTLDLLELKNVIRQIFGEIVNDKSK
jgi:Ca2+-binding EF-hand superfamily protein